MGLMAKIFGDGDKPGAASDAGSAVQAVETQTTPAAGTAEGSFREPSDGGLGELVAAVATEHGAGTGAAGAGKPPAKGKGGRPPIHGKYSRANGSDGKHAVVLPGEAPVEPVEVVDDLEPEFGLPPDLVREFVDEGLGEAGEYLRARLESAAKRANIPDDEAEPLIRSASLGETKRRLIAKATPYALREHGIDPQVSPTACIGAVVLVWGIAHLRTMKAFEQRRAENQTTKPE